jgi:hypothetical protein
MYLLGINLGLRSGEHRKLRQFGPSDEFFQYTEWASKNNPGGMKRKLVKPKKVKVFRLEDERRCPVVLLNKYLTET